MRYRFNTVSFLHNFHNRHPIAHPWERGMGCLLWVSRLIHILHKLLMCGMQYVVILNRVGLPVWAQLVSECFNCTEAITTSLQWRHNGRDGVSNHQPHHCLLNRLFRRRSKKTSKLYITGLCAGNSAVTGEFPAQMASTAENVSIWRRHHVYLLLMENRHKLFWF